MDFSFFNWEKKELAVVMGIILAILGISTFQLRTAEMKTRDAQRKADIELVTRALGKYFSDYNTYPAATASGQITACGERGRERCVWGNSDIVDVENVVYLKNIPMDPQSYSGKTYVYVVDEKRQHYRIYAALEYRQDPAWKEGLDVKCGSNTACNWYAGY
jgi:hypothetical protein